MLSDDVEDIAGIQYRPKTRESKSTYEVLLTFIQAAIGDQVKSFSFQFIKRREFTIVFQFKRKWRGWHKFVLDFIGSGNDLRYSFTSLNMQYVLAENERSNE